LGHYTLKKKKCTFVKIYKGDHTVYEHCQGLKEIKEAKVDKDQVFVWSHSKKKVGALSTWSWRGRSIVDN